MSTFGNRIRAALIEMSMRNARFDPYRQRIAGAAQGRILEIGIGSGLNLAHYGPGAGEIFGVDPSPDLLARAVARGRTSRAGLRLIEGSAERLPVAAHSFDTAIMTWTGCSIPDIRAAYAETRRALRPGGRLLFVEHGRAPDAGVARWQDRLTPVWCCISGGCHLNRAFDVLLEECGFQVERLETGYMSGYRPFAFIYEGSARPR